MTLKAMTSASLLSSFQSSLTTALKAKGLIPMSVGITKSTRVADNFNDVALTAIGQMDDAQAQFGTRAYDRYSGADGYTASRFAMIASLESISAKSYPDSGGRSVGLGFHMSKSGARDVWAKAFGKDVSFDDVYAGKASLTTAQSKHLFDNDILYYEKVVDTALGGKAVTNNQRLALVSIAYNAPERVAKLASVLQTGTNAQITAALLTQTFNPNHSQVDAIKQRRFVETSLFNSASEASALMPKFDDYYAAVAVEGGNVTVMGRKVTSNNAQLNLMPNGEGGTTVSIPTDNMAAISYGTPTTDRPKGDVFNATGYLVDLSYNNAKANRNLKVEANLEAQLRASVTSVYGTDYRVEIISGGDVTGTGTRRHGTMTAADVYIYDPSGKRLNAEQLRPLAQDWIARDIGSVGVPAKGSTQSMHLDLIGGSVPGSTPLQKTASGKMEGRFWFYGGTDADVKTALTNKVAPAYVLSPDAVMRGFVPPGSIPSVGTKLDTTKITAPIPASVERRALARGGAAASEMDLAAIAALEAKNAAANPLKAVKPPVQGLRLPVAPVVFQATRGTPNGAAGFKPQTATEAFPGNRAATVFDETWNTDGTRKVPLVDVAVPAVVRQASIAGKSPLANGASLKVPARGTGSMGIPAASAAIPRTTVRSTYIAPRAQPVYGVSATGARTDYGASPGQSTAGLKPGDRTYNADTNSWELK